MPKRQKDGLYHTKVKIGVDENGKTINKWISGKTKRELEEKRTQVRERYITGKVVDTNVLFGVYAQKWFKLNILSHMSQNTIAIYRSMLNKHLLPEFGEIAMPAIMSDDIQAFINELAGMSETSIQHILSLLNRILTSAQADRIIVYNPAMRISLPTVAEPHPRRALTDAERKAVLSHMDSSQGGIVLALLYYLGIRIGEISIIRWGDIDWEAGVVHVRGYKTKAAARIVPLPNALRDILLPVRQHPEAFVVPREGGEPSAPLCTHRIRVIFNDMMNAAGLSENGLTPHYFRHNYITMCWRAGIDSAVVSKIVGHTDAQTTLNIYTHLTNADIASQGAQFNSMFEKKVGEKLVEPL